MKKVVCLLLSLLLIIVTSVSLADSNQGDFRGFHWEFKNGTLTISGKGNLEEHGDWASFGKKIKTIVFSGEQLYVKCQFDFDDYPKVTSIRFDEGAKGAAQYAFACFHSNKIRLKLYINSKDYQFDASSFYFLKIDDIIVGKGVKNIKAEDGLIYNRDKSVLLGYYGKKRDVVIVPDTVKKIANSALEWNEAKAIYLPDGLEEIGHQAFRDCPNLKQITIPGCVKRIGGCCFSECERLVSLNYVNLNLKQMDGYPNYCHSMHSIKTLIIPNFDGQAEVEVKLAIVII